MERQSMMVNMGRRHRCGSGAGKDMMLWDTRRRGILQAGCSSTVR